jgi:hypothetical protein
MKEWRWSVIVPIDKPRRRCFLVTDGRRYASKWWHLDEGMGWIMEDPKRFWDYLNVVVRDLTLHMEGTGER